MRERLRQFKAPRLFAVLALVFVGLFVLLLAMDRDVPDGVLVVTALLLGFVLGYARSDAVAAEDKPLPAPWLPDEERP